MNKYLPLIFLSQLQPDFAGEAVWARSVAEGRSESAFTSVTIGKDGVYAAGIINEDGTYTFGDQSVNGISTDEYNPVLVKYDWDGNAIWARTADSGPLTDEESLFFSVAADSDNIYAAGIIQGNVTPYTFGGQEVIGSYGGGNVLLVKYDKNGNAVWARSTDGGTSASEFYSVSIGGDGIYTAGTIREDDAYTFGTQTVTGPYASHKNALLVKYDAEGNALWAKSATTGPDRSCFNAVAAGEDGVYAAGFIMDDGTFAFGAHEVKGSNASGFNAVLVKYDAAGNALWAKSVAAGTDNSEFSSVSIGSDGIYAAGYMSGSGTYTFGDQSVNGTSPGLNAVLVKYDADGNVVWARTTSEGSDGSCLKSVFAGKDAVYVAGYITDDGTYTFGDQSVNGINDVVNSVVLVKYDTAGTALWARSVTSGTGVSMYNSVAMGRKGLFTAGTIFGTGDYSFDISNIITAKGTYADPDAGNALLVKYE